MTDTKQIPERFRETMRYRRRLLQSRRTRNYRRAAQETVKQGTPHSRTEQLIRKDEREIREFNALAQEMNLQPIRT